MPRIKGSGVMGPVRSLRLPVDLDMWFETRLREYPNRSASELLLEVFHGGLRLEHGYMQRHRRAVEALLRAEDRARCAAYIAALRDTFGAAYVDHLNKWIEAESGRSHGNAGGRSDYRSRHYG
ncbi:MAG: hypothetical protein ABI182_08370 [Candidatus Baltobacteraceae bacterium]